MSDCTPSQTVGPFFHFGLCFDRGAVVVEPGTAGAITIEGQVFDGAGAPVPDALLEFWQADDRGRYRCVADPRGAGLDDGFDGFGRVPTDADGRFRIVTIKPGPVAGASTGADQRVQAPHLLINVFARGLLTPQLTRLYFADEPSNQDDPVLALVPESRRVTLIARGAGEACYHWDLVLQGARETVFFDVR
jgi:protocatechuate 3,4-dioxygenase alpha subunit